MLARSPGFTAVAVLTLALGIGANTAMFSLVDTLLLKSLPVENPERLVNLSIPEGRGSFGFPYPLYETIRDRNQTLSGVFAVTGGRMNVSVDGRAELAAGGGQFVSGSFYSTLGVKAVAGRTFTAEDDQAGVSGSSGPVAVISYSYWKRRFALDPSAVGKAIRVNGQPFTIVGVTPPRFFGVALGASPDVTAPLTYSRLNPGSDYLSNRTSWSLNVVARLKPGVTVAQATADLNVVFQQYLAEVGGSTQRNFASKRIELASGARGISGMDEQVGQSLLVLMAVVGLVLLIACANLANLLLARGAARYKEMAVRASLGAARWRLIRQLLTESLLLAGMGGAAGLLCASWVTAGILKLLARGSAPVPIDLSPDARMFTFTAAVSVLTGLLFGIVPAFQGTRLDLNLALKENSRQRTAGRARYGLRGALVVSQVALSLLLLIVAGLFTRSLRKLMAVNLGFHAEHVLVLSVDPVLVGYKDARLAGLYRDLLERLESTPAVLAASFSRYGLLTGGSWQNSFSLPGHTPRRGERLESNFSPVGPRFFQTAGIPLLLGRDFRPQDNESAPKVAIISEILARDFFPGENPVGRTMGLGVLQNLGLFEIVGVAKDAKYGSLRERPQRVIYLPFWQLPYRLMGMMGSLTLEVRTAADPAAMAAAIRREMLAIEKDLPIYDVKSLTEKISDGLTEERTVATLAGLFGLLALLLACVGLYGVMSYSVVRRTNEIGIRMALGAQRGDVIWLVQREAMVLVGLGAAVGLAAALGAARVMGSLLFGLAPTDPVTISMATLLMMCVAALAGYLPARYASRVDPMVALRME